MQYKDVLDFKTKYVVLIFELYVFYASHLPARVRFNLICTMNNLCGNFYFKVSFKYRDFSKIITGK